MTDHLNEVIGRYKNSSECVCVHGASGNLRTKRTRYSGLKKSLNTAYYTVALKMGKRGAKANATMVRVGEHNVFRMRVLLLPLPITLRKTNVGRGKNYPN